MKNPKNRKGIKIIWTDWMLDIIKNKFATEYNKYLAIETGVSLRSLIRKARELGINKEPRFPEIRKMTISAWAQAAKADNKNKGRKGWCVPNSEAYRFKKGHVSPMNLPEIRKKVSNSRLNRIADERLRIELGLPQLTKLNLKISQKP